MYNNLFYLHTPVKHTNFVCVMADDRREGTRTNEMNEQTNVGAKGKEGAINDTNWARKATARHCTNKTHKEQQPPRLLSFIYA